MTGLRAGSATDVGRVRSDNEDRFLVADNLFAVADGLGGHRAGEVASSTAVETLRTSFHDRTVAALVDAAKAANRAVYEMAQRQPDLQGMATTLTAVALVQEDGHERLAVINVGDSRAYLLDQDGFTQITDDDSLVGDLLRTGKLTPEEAAVHPQRSIITKALGLEPDVEVTVAAELDPYRGQRVLLCSDGLTNEVTDNDIASTLRRSTDPEAAARDLVQQARANGGSDNITVVVVDVVDDDGRAEQASAALSSDPVTTGSAPSRPASDRAAEERLRPDAAAPAGPRATVPLHARRATWRVVAFSAVLLAILAVAVAAFVWFARGHYYVGVSGDRVAIFRGRPGGLLWVKPSLEQRTSLSTNDVLPVDLQRLQEGKEEPSLGDAQRYVNRLRQKAAEAKRAAAPPTTTGPPPSPPPSSPPP